ncbi:MAG: formate dehydrogenase subunit alpha [Firmicutes bacterium]|nr:formate dehydrogenase subunit alpha [Bacillota bacterium]
MVGARESSEVVVRINSQEVHVPPGSTLLQAAERANVLIPHVCFHPQLGAIQTCDTCLVEVDGQLVRACATEAAPNLQVVTTSEQVRQAQTEAMDRILHNHKLYCTVCDNNNGNCIVHNTTELIHINHQKYPFAPKPYPQDNSNPFYRYDPDQCILCGRCVEACQDLEVNETLSIDWQRERPRVVWDADVAIDRSSCVSCGHCVTVCPCNALMEKNMLGNAGFLTGIDPDTLVPLINYTKDIEPGYDSIFAISDIESRMRMQGRIQRTKTVCTYCGVGCAFEIWTKGRQILKVEPKTEAPANGISTCIKGKFGWEYVKSQERLTTPLIREGESFRPASWEEAIARIAQRLNQIKQKEGADAIGLISSSKCSNEENYLMQKLARAVIGTNNVDNCARYCQTPATEGLFRTVGYGGDAGSIADLEKADLVLIVGANPAENHPVLATRIKRAHKLHGQKLVVIDLRKNEMAERADLFIHPNPGTDLVLINAIAHQIIDRGWEDRAFLERRVNGFDAYKASIASATLEEAACITGVSRDTIVAVAEMIHQAQNGTAICWAMGVTQHKGGSATSTALSNLLLLTGNYGKPGCGAFPLRGHNNVQGAGDFGTLPKYLPGYEEVSDPQVRAKYERAWGVSLPQQPGLDNHRMVEAIEEGKLKALYVMGEDMAVVDSNANRVQAAFEKLDFMVVQDIFFTRTAQYADVILPGAPSLEKEGTFTNTERRIQRFYPALPTLGEALPDWQILQRVANALGAGWMYEHPAEIMEEAASLAQLLAGVSYERLEGFRSLQWPVRPDGIDTPVLYTDRFPFEDGKARLYPVDWIPPVQMGEAYDLHVNNGRLLEHFDEGNMTYRVPGIAAKVPGPWVEVSPALAQERGLQEGSLVRLDSPFGFVVLPVLVTDRVQGHELYIPMNSSEQISMINNLTSSESDEATHTPAFKEVSVRMTILQPQGPSPLPEANHRRGHRRPQRGVCVQQKWQRPDYRPLAESIEAQPLEVSLLEKGGPAGGQGLGNTRPLTR